jgi:hypothetical protein
MRFVLVSIFFVSVFLLAHGDNFEYALVFLVDSDWNGGQLYYGTETDANLVAEDDSILKGSFQGFLDGDLVLYEGSSVLVLSTRSISYLYPFETRIWMPVPLDLGQNPIGVASLDEGGLMTLVDNNLFNAYALDDLIQGGTTPGLSSRIATLEGSSLSPLTTSHGSRRFQSLDTNGTFWTVDFRNDAPKTMSFAIPAEIKARYTIAKAVAAFNARGAVRGCTTSGTCVILIDTNGNFSVWDVLGRTPTFLPLRAPGTILSVAFKDSPSAGGDPPVLVIVARNAANGFISMSIYDLRAQKMIRTIGIGVGSNAIVYLG